VTERRDAAVASLGTLPAHALPEVARGLSHPDPAVRRRTVDVLARFRSPEATRHIGAAFEDSNAGVRETAVVAITRLGSSAYDQALRELAASDPSKAVRRAAATALASRRSSQ
jgi:HEAT repeat protein